MCFPTRRLAAATLGLLGAAASAQEAGTSSREIPAPTFVVGDSWSFRETDLLTKNETGQITETVVKADAAEYLIDARRKARTWRRGDAVKHVHREQFEFSEGGPEQRGKTIASNDAGCAYPYPLKVGKSWECTELTTWARSGSSGSRRPPSARSSTRSARS